MIKLRRRDVVVGIATGLALVSAWPVLSQAWIGVLKAVAAPAASGGEVYGPAAASAALPIALAVLVALPLPAKRTWWYASVTLAAALTGELLLVVLGAAAHIPGDVMSVGGGLVQNAIPLVMVLLAMAEARAAQAPYTRRVR